MAWTAITPTAKTWTASGTATTKTWTADSATKRCWTQLSPVGYTSYDLGVNFVLRVNDQAPLCISDTLPFVVMDANDVQRI